MTMAVKLRKRGEEEYIEFVWPTLLNTEMSSITVAKRAIEVHDPHGDGKVWVNDWSYRYVGGKIQPPKHC